MNSYYSAVSPLARASWAMAVGLAALGLAGCSRPPEHSGVPAMSAVAIAPAPTPAPAETATVPEVTVATKAPAVRIGVASQPAASTTIVAAPPASAPPAERGRAATRIQAGRVLDESGQPLVGATIILRGTTKGTSTDITGSYMLEVPKGENTFTIGYAGYENETANSRDGQPLTVTLLPSPSNGPPPLVPRKRR